MWLTVTLGTILLFWIVLQVYWVGLISFLQYLFFAFACAELVLSLLLWRRHRRFLA